MTNANNSSNSEAIAIIAIAIDFETTCATSEAQATELGLCPVIFSANGILNPRIDAISVRCKPERDISFGSMAVTGICPEDVANEPSHSSALLPWLPKGPAYVIGHNIDFDIQVAKNAGIDVSEYKAICTLAMSRELYPDAQHSLGAMLYMLDYDYARQHAQNAHSAAHDVRFCIRLLRIFCREVGITDMQSLYEYSEQARIPKIMSLKKHKGKAITDMAKNSDGRGYLQWVIDNIEDSPYLVKACQQALKVKE